MFSDGFNEACLKYFNSSYKFAIFFIFIHFAISKVIWDFLFTPDGLNITLISLLI